MEYKTYTCKGEMVERQDREGQWVSALVAAEMRTNIKELKEKLNDLSPGGLGLEQRLINLRSNYHHIEKQYRTIMDLLDRKGAAFDKLSKKSVAYKKRIDKLEDAIREGGPIDL